MTIAGACAIAASVTLLVSGGCLAIFFASGTEAWGRANDATTAAFAVLMIPAIVAVADRYLPAPGWRATILTLVGVAGLLVVAVTSGMTAAAKLDWLISAKIGGAGFAGFLIWMGGVCVLNRSHGDLPQRQAVFGLVTLGIVAVAGVLTFVVIRRRGRPAAEMQLPAALMGAIGLAFLCFLTWTVGLGIGL